MPVDLTQARCATCRWWQKPVGGDTFGECGLARSWMDEPLRAATLAWARDEEGAKAYLLTSPSFGCVQWEEEKADATDPS